MVGPDYTPPELATPASFPGAPEKTEVAVALTNWWVSFREPELDALVAKSLLANHQRRLALARLAEARALLGIAAARLGPRIDTSASAVYTDWSDHGVIPFALQPTDLYQAGFDSSWELDIWGAVRRAREGATADLEAAQVDVVDVANTVAAESVRLWFHLRYLRGMERIASERVSVAGAKRDCVALRRGAGLASAADLATAQAAVAAAESALPPLAAAAAQTRHAIAVLTGEAPGTHPLVPAVERPLPALPNELAIGVPADLLRRRPDLRRAERRLAAATARVGVAQADLYPRLSLDGSFGLQSVDITTLAKGGSQFWTAGPTVRWNLLDWGKVRNTVNAAEARVEQALVMYEGALLVAQKDVADALAALEQDRLRARAVERVLDENARNERMTAELRRRGIVDALAGFDRRQITLQSEEQRLQAQLAQLLDTVALAKALGGGWEPDAALAPAVSTADNSRPGVLRND
jgi:NodT family efflux transporter outer membrane factor (OMF) lipoprotein